MTRGPPTSYLTTRRRRTSHGRRAVRSWPPPTKPPRPVAREAPNHFEKKWNGPCPNHGFPVKNLLKDCSMMKRFLRKEAKKGDAEKPPKPGGQDPTGDDDDEQGGPVFPNPKAGHMIFTGP
ncbi:hypothetical protein PR202_gb17166 [Eleusine coracana subsp. coracana]|uniref:Uncharacterized protein n=1 Tax=Eleusine coracana subsp. coracana TaxID=191504 RepID=A0AAV5F278_ELECO|nr:hypothetical protein PR202_gb17166 [Eleusine coracana subsp. coracana]